ncbi:MAG TPA: hypothetical protein VOB72_22980 [Candidatus Dormibacteraeota bacterium]|nr:hypothetical protein [Candidatus Dormibacteraeota bacterium]
MRAGLESAGERIAIESAVPWVSGLIEEACQDALGPDPGGGSVRIHVEATRERFDLRGWELLTRGIWCRAGQVVVEDVCTSGFDVHVLCSDATAEFTYRWRPPARERVAMVGLRSRFHLLARAALLQYPALWSAGLHGRTLLHIAVCTAGEATPLLAGPGGVGKSTLLAWEVGAGGRAAGDNICVTDGRTAWALVEPLRIENGGGRKMPHGRAETVLEGRVSWLVPDRVLVLRRGLGDEARVSRCDPGHAARVLVTSTYMAGELRRYWELAAALSAGTGLGPAHPRIEEAARALTSRLPCLEVVLPIRPGPRLVQLLQQVEALT